jgi:hypothetical protein
MNLSVNVDVKYFCVNNVARYHQGYQSRHVMSGHVKQKFKTKNNYDDFCKTWRHRASCHALSTKSDVEMFSGTVTAHRRKDVRFISYENGVFTIEGSLGLSAPPHLVFDILSDYDECASIFHNILESTAQPTSGQDFLVTQVAFTRHLCSKHC